MAQFKTIKNIWEEIGPHKGYLMDSVRNNSYRAAIKKYASPQKVALDVGCGTGILSLFAAQAGFRRVYSVEITDFIRHAKKTTKLNGFSRQVKFLQKSIFDVVLEEAVDVIIHDQIGDFLWDEGMLSKIGYARDHLLKKGGIILPAEFELYLVPISLLATAINPFFWKKKIYGIDFGNLEKEELRQWKITCLPRRYEADNCETFMAKPVLAARVNLYERGIRPRPISVSFKIHGPGGLLTAVMGFFKVRFDKEIFFETRPASPNTNWGQFVLPVLDQRELKGGEIVHLSLNPNTDIRKWKWNLSYGRLSPYLGKGRAIRSKSRV